MADDTQVRSAAKEPGWWLQTQFIGWSVVCFVAVVLVAWEDAKVGMLIWLGLDLFEKTFPQKYLLDSRYETYALAIEILSYVFLWCAELIYFAVRRTPPEVRYKYVAVCGILYMLFQLLCGVIQYGIGEMIRNGVIVT